MKEMLISKYEDLRFIIYRLGNIQADLRNELIPKSTIERKLLKILDEDFNTTLANAIDITGLIIEISQTDTEQDLEFILETYHNHLN